MKVASVTQCYPTAGRPVRGLPILRRLSALANRVELRGVFLQPCVPGLRRPEPPLREYAPGWARYWTMPYVPGPLRWAHPWFVARAARRALGALQEEFHFDVIDAHFVWPDGVGAFLAGEQLGKPVAITLRGTLVSRQKNPLMRGQIRRALRGARVVIAVSQSLAELARRVAGEDLRVHVVANGIDTKQFYPMDRADARRLVGEPTNCPIAVCVGSTEPGKGFGDLVAIWPEVMRRCGGARLVLVGPDGKRRGARLAERIEGSSLAGAVGLVGWQSPRNVNLYLNAADLFVLHSRSEGWCNAIAEALATGTPVVASDVGGNREQIGPNGCGLLVPYGDRGALIEAVAEGLARAWDRGRIAAVGRARSWEAVAERLEAILREAVG
jgi:teichuronic acid biosynthesis glycosyltransferase TuaC